MSAKTQIGIAALAASIATLIVPLCTGLWYVFGPPVLNADGSPDNAPVRSAALLLFASPLFVFGLIVYFTIGPIILRRIHRLTLGTLVALNFVPSLVVAALFAAQGFRAFGPTDAAISFGVFGSLSIVLLNVGSVTWWLVARPRNSAVGVYPPAV